jgi:putative tricarboxylic transport membrane protein
VIGLLMKLNGFPTAPLILALILGDLMEENMRRALQISGGDWLVFLQKPISLTLLIIAAVSLFLPIILGAVRRKGAGTLASR